MVDRGVVGGGSVDNGGMIGGSVGLGSMNNGGVVGSGLWGVVRGRGVDLGCMVGGGSVGLGGMGSGAVVGLARVGDVGDVAGVIVSDGVLHGLETAVGESDMVLTIGGVAIAGLIGAKVGAVVVVMDSIGVLVVGGLLLVGGAMRGRGVVWGRGMVGGRDMSSRGGGHKSEEGNKGLKEKKRQILFSRSKKAKECFFLPSF